MGRAIVSRGSGVVVAIRRGIGVVASWRRGVAVVERRTCAIAAGVEVDFHCARVAVTVDVRVVGLERVVGATRERGARGRN